MVKVWVPTKNQMKIRVVETVFIEFPFVEGEPYEVRGSFLKDLEVPPLRQPIGWKQIANGAQLRAKRSYDLQGEGYHIGMQSGITSYEMSGKSVWMDQSCVYVLCKYGRTSISGFAATATVEVPDFFAEAVKNGRNELGALVEYYSKREDKDAVAFFSRHQARREDFLLDALLSALGSISFREEFGKRPPPPPLRVVK